MSKKDKKDISWWDIMALMALSEAMGEDEKVDKETQKRRNKEALRKELRNKWFHLEVIIMMVPFIWFMLDTVTGRDSTISSIAFIAGLIIALAIDFIRKLIKQIREQ